MPARGQYLTRRACERLRRLMFGVGPTEVPSFRMIERHYFKDKLLRSYDFTFGFCIPNSTNSWEAIYPMPNQSKDDISEMVRVGLAHGSCPCPDRPCLPVTSPLSV